MHEGFLDARGISFRINNHQSDRKTLVFIHGLSGSASAWAEYEEYFKQTHNIVTYDLRGHGRSIRPRAFDEYQLSFFADDLNFLLSHLHISSCTLISHSLGAQVALEYLSRINKNNAERAIFLAPVHHLNRRWFLQITQWAWKFVAALSPASVTGRRTDYSRFIPTGDWDPRRVMADVFNTGLRSYLWALHHAYSADTDSIWPTLKLPILIVHGVHDTYIPIENSRELARILPHAKLVELKDANHILILNNPKEVIESIENF